MQRVIAGSTLKTSPNTTHRRAGWAHHGHRTSSTTTQVSLLAGTCRVNAGCPLASRQARQLLDRPHHRREGQRPEDRRQSRRVLLQGVRFTIERLTVTMYERLATDLQESAISGTLPVGLLVRLKKVTSRARSRGR